MKVRQISHVNIFSLRPKQPDNLLEQARFPAIGRTHAYWAEQRNGGAVPARADIDPRGLAEVLENTFILERVAPGVARFRLAGMHLNDLMCMEVRGMPMTAMFSAPARQQISQIIEQVCAAPAISIVNLCAPTGANRTKIVGKLFLAPLKNEDGEIDRILGALQSDMTPGQNPCRFDILGAETSPLQGRFYSAPTPAAAPEFADSPAQFAPAPKNLPPARPALRLIVDNA